MDQQVAYSPYYIFILNFEYFMGKCASAPVRKKTVLHEREVVQCQSLRGKTLPKLNFHAVLSNVILKKYPYKRAVLTFRLQQQQFSLEPRATTSEDYLKWKIHEKLDFQMTQYDLRRNVLEVIICDQGGQRVGGVRINLFLITTGPFHQDFAIQFANQRTGRITFDLKISQIIALKIQCISAEISLLRNHPGEEFSFSIKTIVGYNGSTAESQPSYPALVLLQKKAHENSEQEALEKELVLGRRNSLRLSTKEIQVGRDLRWSLQGVLPFLSTKVLSSELHNTYFQKGSDDNAEREFFADSYVSFYKLFGAEPAVAHQGEQEFESRTIIMTEKIERYGKDCGRGTFSFNIINQHYFRQYQTCVHTETGILRTAPIFAEEDSTQKCQQLQELLHISEAVQQNVFLLNKLQSDQASNFQIKRVKVAIESDLQKMFHLLQKSALPPRFLYKYNSAGELLQGQKVLVELGMKITTYFQIEDPVINDIAWLILISLLKRTEFSLSHMGFQERQKRAIQSRTSDRGLMEKLRISGIYKMFMYKLLGLALNSLNRKGSEYERTFAEIFSAYAYFRIPEFRREVLRLITKEEDPEIIQWRGVEFNLQDDITEPLQADGANIFSELFDWEQHFYKWLPRDEELDSEDISLNDTLAQSHWRERFTRRGLAFFYFLKYWVTYIESSLPEKKDIQWRYFPGYNRLLKGFFVEMKQRPILLYPDALIQSCFKLLINEKLVNPVIKILLNKVNIYDTSAVLRVIQYLNLIFKSFTSRKKALPISFNYSFFFKGIKIILQSEFAMGISCALSLLYNHFQLFHIQFRRSLSMYLLGSIFFKLFLNWSHTVRNVFYHLITYKIYAQAHYNEGRAKQKFMIADSDILTRYDELMKIMQVEEVEYNKKKVQELQNNLDKNYYKKMKFKAYHKMRSTRLESQSIFNTKAESEIKNNSDHNNYQNIKTQIKFNLSTSRRNIIINEKHHSSQANLAAKIGHQNKQNHLTQQQPSRKSVFSFERDDTDHQFTLFQRIIHQKQFEIQELQFEKIKYISIYRPKFKEVETHFFQCLQSEDRRCPTIKIEMSIDNREIRPQKIDQW